MPIKRSLEFVKSHVIAYLKRHGLKDAVRRFSYKNGLPQGISPGIVESFLRRNGGGELVVIQHCHMSAWKNAGSYRLVLRCRPRRAIRLVFKDANYSDVDIPALKGLPVTPGAAEYFFFKQANGPARAYLPEIHHAEEVSPKSHYRYLMQDLSVDHRNFAGSADVIKVCEFLPRVQDALLESATGIDDAPLIRYNRDFDDQLLGYARQSLESYQDMRCNGDVERLLSEWPEFAARYARSSGVAYELQPLTVVHGDFNIGNMMIHRRNDTIRVFDLEWAGWGLPHGDLASALLGKPRDLEEQCLAAFHRNLGLHTLDEDRVIYRHARLQRAVLNASFVAKQLLCAGEHIPAWFSKFVSNECKNALDIFKVLR